MGRLRMSFGVLFCVWAVAQTITSTPAQAKLSPLYYEETCPEVFSIVAVELLEALVTDSRIGASLLRMHFHDCFVQGCDGSILLDGPGTSEMEFIGNKGSVRGFPVIDKIKAALEEACPNVVSCADTVALGSFFGIIFAGGPAWAIPLGRRDSLAPNFAETFTHLAGPASDITKLKDIWSLQNFTSKQLVSLSGAHTIGDSRCITLNLSTTNVNPQLNSVRTAALQRLCLNGNSAASENTTGMDFKTPRKFDNSYFKQFPTNGEVFKSDAALLNASDTRKLVKAYAADQDLFFVDFVSSMIKMGNLRPLLAPNGQIRKKCNAVNPSSSEFLRMPGEASEPERVPRELTEKEQEEFVQNIKATVARVTADYVVRHFDKTPFITDTLFSSYYEAY